MSQPSAPSSHPSGSSPTPERILQYAWGFAATHALGSAVELDVFSHVALGKTTPSSLAQAVGGQERPVRMLCDALVGLGLLTRTGAAGPLGLAPDAAAFLVKGSPAYIGDFIVFHAGPLMDGWRSLTETVRTGRPPIALDKPSEAQPFWDRLVDSLFAMNAKAAMQVGEELGRRYPGKAIALLDVAAGSGVWGLGAALSNPNVRVTATDLAPTLEHTKRFVARTGLAARTELLPGDLRTLDLGTARYDAAVLGHILHSEGPEHAKRLVERVGRALRPGGTLVIAEFVPAPDRNGPPMPLLFALNMLVHTTDGDTFTLPQMRAWCEAAGLRDVVEMPAAAASPLVLATKR